MPIFQPSVSSLKDKRDVAGLVKLLKSKDDRTRRAAIQALGEIGAQPSTTALAELLLNNDTHHVDQVQAAQALGAILDPAAVSSLLQATTISREREQQLIASANASPDRSRAGFTINLIASDEFELRHAIAQALAKIGGEQALQGLFDMLASETGPMENSGKTTLRAAIAEMLDGKPPYSLQVLFNQLAAPAVESRLYAAERLGEFRDSTAVDRLIAVATNESEVFVVRQAAIASLGRIGDDRALPCLEELSHSDNRAVARDARFNARELWHSQTPESD